MIKIGGVSLDVSHPMGFAEELEKYCMDMKYEYICPKTFRGDEEADWFVKRFHLQGKVNTIEEMVANNSENKRYTGLRERIREVKGIF